MLYSVHKKDPCANLTTRKTQNDIFQLPISCSQPPASILYTTTPFRPPRLKSKAMQAAQGKVTLDHPNRNVKPAPASTPSPSPTPPATPPKTFAKSNRGATSPLFGASGVSRLRLRSMPAFDGNVGNISFAFGLGSSRKYGCERHVAASGREAGFSARRWERRVRPAVVR